MTDNQGKSQRNKTDFGAKPLPDKIGSSLRKLYDEVLSEDVPDDFLNLLRKADKKSSNSNNSGAST